MTASTVFVLDEQTRRELQPPCECLVGRPAERCTRAAAWAVTVRCGVDQELSYPLLVCAECIDAFACRRVTCMCHPGTVPVSVASVVAI